MSDVTKDFLEYWNEVSKKSEYIDLGMGMPSPELFGLEEEKGIIDSIKSGRYKYSPQVGEENIRIALAQFESEKIGVKISPENIMLVGGALRGFSLVTEVLITSARRVIEITPSYPLLSGHIRHLQKQRGFEIIIISPSEVNTLAVSGTNVINAINKNAIVYLTNPSNPTGRYTNPQSLLEIVETVGKNDGYLIVDETCDIPFQNKNFPQDWKFHPNTVRINSFSKNFLLAGFRIGYIVASKEIIQLLSTHYSFSDGNAPIVANGIIIQNLKNSEINKKIPQISNQCIQKAVGMLKNNPAIDCIIEPEACYYLFLKIKSKSDDWTIFKSLLDQGINVLPGRLFGMGNEPWIRICCAKEENVLEKNIEKLSEVLSTI